MSRVYYASSTDSIQQLCVYNNPYPDSETLDLDPELDCHQTLPVWSWASVHCPFLRVMSSESVHNLLRQCDCHL